MTERFGAGTAVAAPASPTPTSSPSTVRSTPTTTASTMRPIPTTTRRVQPRPGGGGLVRHPQPSSARGSLDGSGEVDAGQPGLGALAFTGTSIMLPVGLVGLALVSGGVLALGLGRRATARRSCDASNGAPTRAGPRVLVSTVSPTRPPRS